MRSTILSTILLRIRGTLNISQMSPINFKYYITVKVDKKVMKTSQNGQKIPSMIQMTLLANFFFLSLMMKTGTRRADSLHHSTVTTEESTVRPERLWEAGDERGHLDCSFLLRWGVRVTYICHDKATYTIHFDEWRCKAFCLFVLKKWTVWQT